MNTITWQIENIKDLGDGKIQVLWLCDASKDGIHKAVAGYSVIELDSSIVPNKTEQEILDICFENGVDKLKNESNASELLEVEILNPTPQKTDVKWNVTKEEYEQAKKEGRITKY